MRKAISVAMLIAMRAGAATYYVSPIGSDSNAGTSVGSPWLTPNHSLNGGDVIIAASGTYAYLNFTAGQWGTVTCSGAHCVARLTCNTFDACKMTSGGIHIDQSHWQVDGWEFSSTGGGGCLGASPGASSNLQDIVIANNVVNNCGGPGIFTYNNGSTSGADYVAVIGNIVYHAAYVNSTGCNSGIDLFVPPVASDTVAGTHVYVAGNFSYDTVEPNPCGGGTPTDGEGIIVDETAATYYQQVVIDNNITFLNAGRGIAQAHPGSTFIRANTSVWNAKSLYIGSEQAEILFNNVGINNQAFLNLTLTSGATSPGGSSIYNYYVENTNGNTKIFSNFGYSAAGQNISVNSSPGFVAGVNLFGSDPVISVSDPGAPGCGAYANTVACMSSVIAMFTPGNSAALPYGYQMPSTTPIHDSLYPKWLCGLPLPSGLVTPGCLTSDIGVRSAMTLRGTVTIR